MSISPDSGARLPDSFLIKFDFLRQVNKQGEYKLGRTDAVESMLCGRSNAMDSTLTTEPVSAHVPAFHDLVGRAFANQEAVVLLFRYANCGGAKDYFIARSIPEFQTALAHGRPKTSITVFFKSNFAICGLADDELCRRTIEFLGEVRDQYEGVDLIRTDGTKIDLDSQHFVYATTPSEIGDWFQLHRGKPVLVGTMEFWQDNSARMVTVYVPDNDGVVRPGAY